MTDKQSPTPEDQREANTYVEQQHKGKDYGSPEATLVVESGAYLAYLAGVLRERERSKAEVERLRSGLSMAAMLDAGVPHALLMKDYREAVLQMNEERHEVAKVARALLAAGEKAGGENEG